MNYKFSKHVKKRLKLRKISEDILKDVLENPGQKVSGQNDETIYQSKVIVDGKQYLIRIAVYENVNPSVVATVYRTSKIGKYWRKKKEEVL